MEHDDEIVSEQLVASSTIAENKSIDFDDFNSPNSSIMVTGLSSPEFDTEFKTTSDVNLFNSTDISTGTDKDTNKDHRMIIQKCFSEKKFTFF